jgi:hypothetical protein
LPFPEYVTDNVLVVVGGPVKFAVTSYLVPSTSGTSHVLPVGAGQPSQWSKLQSAAGVAVSVIVPLPENATWQVVEPSPQFIPAGLLVTVPFPITWDVTSETASVRPPALPTPSTNGRRASATTQLSFLPFSGAKYDLQLATEDPTVWAI